MEIAFLAVHLSDSVELQWVTTTCIGFYFIALLSIYYWICSRMGGGDCFSDQAGLFRFYVYAPEILMVILACWATASYAFKYTGAYFGSDFLVLFAGMTLGRAVAAIRLLRRTADQVACFHTPVLDALILMLTALALFHPEMWVAFTYREQERWTGAFLSPNTFGLLMAVGAVLAIGQTLLIFRIKVPVNKGASINDRCFPRWKASLKVVLYIVASGIILVAMIKSYSRGAWLGFFFGLASLGIIMIPDYSRRKLATPNFAVKPYAKYSTVFVHKQPLSCEKITEDRLFPGFRRQSVLVRHVLNSAMIIVLSLGVLAFWSFRHTEQQVLRRVFSVAGAYDFSTENRVMAAIGAFQMMGEKSSSGFGWNEPERAYDFYYRAQKVSEHMAIRTNSYLMVGTALGLVAFGCFLAYVWFLMKGRPVMLGDSCFWTGSSSVEPMKVGVICRAGVLVLLIGFVFDGGLFRLATGAIFWILLELGADTKEDDPSASSHETITNQGGCSSTEFPEIQMTTGGCWVSPNDRNL